MGAPISATGRNSGYQWWSAVIGMLVSPMFDGSDGSVNGVVPRATNLALLGGVRCRAAVRQALVAERLGCADQRAAPHPVGRRHASPSMMHDRERNRASASTIIARSAVEPHPFAGLAQ